MILKGTWALDSKRVLPCNLCTSHFASTVSWIFWYDIVGYWSMWPLDHASQTWSHKLFWFSSRGSLLRFAYCTLVQYYPWELLTCWKLMLPALLFPFLKIRWNPPFLILFHLHTSLYFAGKKLACYWNNKRGRLPRICWNVWCVLCDLPCSQTEKGRCQKGKKNTITGLFSLE